MPPSPIEREMVSLVETGCGQPCLENLCSCDELRMILGQNLVRCCKSRNSDVQADGSIAVQKAFARSLVQKVAALIWLDSQRAINWHNGSYHLRCCCIRLNHLEMSLEKPCRSGPPNSKPGVAGKKPGGDSVHDYYSVANRIRLTCT